MIDVVVQHVRFDIETNFTLEYTNNLIVLIIIRVIIIQRSELF